MINVFEPDVGDLEIRALEQTISSKWIGKGKREAEFRIAFSELVNVPSESIITYNSCTEAFFQLFEFLNLPEDSEVIIPSISFVGVANAVAASKLQIRFCDVDLASGNPEIIDIKKVLSERTRALIFQHYGGNMGSITSIAEFCRKNKILLIEDAAGALGSVLNGKSAGTFGDYGLWSFDAMKSVTCGDGGALYCRNILDTEALRTQGYLGLDFSSGLTRSQNANDRWWNFNVKVTGRRSILNDLSASIGLIQLSRFEEKIMTRRRIYKAYMSRLSKIQEIHILVDLHESIENHSLYFFPICVANRRNELAFFLRSQDIYTTFRYLPLHKQEIYGNTSVLENSEFFSDHVLLLPMHTNLDNAQVELICDLIEHFYAK